MQTSRTGARLGLALRFCAAATLAACGGGGGDDAPPPSPTVEVSVLSSPSPAWVSGGDALVKLRGHHPAGSRLRVLLNGNDISASFAADPVDGRPMAVVTGLALGANTLSAELTEPGRSTPSASHSLQLTNHPRTGPMFSGPWQVPYACQTAAFRLYPGGPFLGAPTDADCSADTRVDYVYRNTATPAAYVPLGDLAQLPADVARFTAEDGRSLPFVVRIETGTVNRAIYQTAMLHDPSASGEPTPAARSPLWNGRLVYSFGGGWYRQGTSVGWTGGVLDANLLARGYAMASSTLNVFGHNCQDVTAAESMAMVKERFIEAYGPPRATIGWGCSGGSYQQHQIADNYPGLLDGILPGCSFPEVAFSTVYSITDMRLLGNYFQATAPGSFTAQQQAEVAGVLRAETLTTGTVYAGAMRIAPDSFCPAEVPTVQRYHPVNNPTGVRCSVYDHTANVFGRDPATGFARRPLDNVGVQYGLRALNAGLITVDQFLDLNERIGGYDIDARFQPARTVADVIAMRESYQTGRLTNGGGGLRDIPIIDYRAYNDDAAAGDIHLRYHSFSMRERLRKANGNTGNHVMLVEDMRHGLYSSASPLLMRALTELDAWIAATAADTAAGTAQQKVLRNRPATLQDGCNTRDANPSFVAEEQQRTAGQCAVLYPAPAAPRHEAGASVAADVIKCALKPVAMADYGVAFTPAQQQRLATVYPDGVCDWAVPGIEQQALRGTWLSF